MEKPYYFSIYLLEDLMSSLVTVMQVLAGTQIRNACEKEKHSMQIGSFSVLNSEQLIELFCIGESALPFSGSSYNFPNLEL